MSYLKIDKTNLVNLKYSLNREIVRTNPKGAMCSSTIIDCNTRKYHGLLICPINGIDKPNCVLLSSIHELLIVNNEAFNLGMHKYAGNIYRPAGHKYIEDFTSTPVPKLTFNVGGAVLTKEKILTKNENQILIKYTLIKSTQTIKFQLKPFLSFREVHKLSKANMNLNTKYQQVENGIASKLYNNYPFLYMQLSKKNEFTAAPNWYYNIEYSHEQKRGYEYKEDLYTPGFFELTLKKGDSIVFSASLNKNKSATLKRKFNTELKERIPRNSFNNCLANTAKQCFVNNANKINIRAGFPWLPIRNRDALISLPGLTLPFYDYKQYLLGLKTIESKFENHLLSDLHNDSESGYPADIPLWFIWSVQQYGVLYGKKQIWGTFGKTIKKIIEGFLNEKQWFSIKNGLIFCPPAKHTNSWMNATNNSNAIITRSGYLVELNALWYNSLRFCLEFKKEFNNQKFENTLNEQHNQTKNAFLKTFWNCSNQSLYDFVDKKPNLQIRPNQIFAASLPYSMLDKTKIKCLIDNIKTELLTPFGLRTLSPIDSEYTAVYKGNHLQRENAAFNGSVWPWLFTSFFQAWEKIEPKSAIRVGENFLKGFEGEMHSDGLCSISELYNGNPPHKAKGAISFAMNVGEIIRLKNLIDNAYKIY